LLDDEGLALLGQFGLSAAADGVENREVGLLDRCYRIVDREARFPFQSLGTLLRALHVVVVLSFCNVRLQRVNVGGDLRFSTWRS
jgi:hypothetical protein